MAFMRNFLRTQNVNVKASMNVFKLSMHLNFICCYLKTVILLLGVCS